jgi:hypothetical protein
MTQKRAAGQTFTRKTVTQQLARELVAEHGSTNGAARAILSQCRDQHGKQASFDAVRKWLQEAGARSILDPAIADKVQQIVNVLENEANIPLEAIEVEHAKIRSGYHEVITKDKDGNPHITKARSKNASVVISPSWKHGPQWPVVQPAKPVVIKNPTQSIAKRDSSRTKTIVVISDIQVGFLRSIEDVSVLTPMHDRQAIDVALKIVADLQPDQLGYVGDFLDLPEMSRWLQVEEFFRVTQPSIDEGYKILAQFEAAAGPRNNRAPTQFLSGNHDRRIREAIVKNARAAFHLRPAASTPDTWPDLTVPRLLRFDELGIEYVGEYPGGEWWITPDLVVRHNPESRNAYAGSVIAGHTHKVSRTTYSRRTPTGPEHSTLFEVGCLCSLEKYGDKASLMATRVPSNRGFVKDWAHSFAVVTVTPDGKSAVELVDYLSPSRAIFRGKEYTS